MSESVVLDTSAVIALLEEETGAETVRQVLFNAVLSAVTVAELYTKLSEWEGRGEKPLLEILFGVQKVEPFTHAQAEAAGRLRAATRSKGLSLGDRCCLALAMEMETDVYTADRAWADLDLACRIHLIR
ncbi:MAG: type II toxin-antitoxin system VapC family toxin [Acidobacteria bacterium]|nr:type II toxin-antitoxin system VapC family toxin [Acidobacteriota bacterium]